MKLPRLDPATKSFYESILPKDPGIETRPMFGGLGSFVHGNMFAGALGTAVFVRLPERERGDLLREPGGGPFEPVKGHAMAEYATLPPAWVREPVRAREAAAKALAWAAAMPPKAKGAKKPRR